MKIRNKRIRERVLGRDMGLCRACGFKAEEVHHIIPIVFGGDDIEENMISLCNICHKHAPDDPRNFNEYIKLGGAKLSLVLGKGILIAEQNKINFAEAYPMVRNVIRWLRECDRTYSLENFNIKESLEIPDVDLEQFAKQKVIEAKK